MKGLKNKMEMDDNAFILNENKMIFDTAKANPGMEIKLSSITEEAQARKEEFFVEEVPEGAEITPENIQNVKVDVLESDYDFQLSFPEGDVTPIAPEDVDPSEISPELKNMIDHIAVVNKDAISFTTDDSMKLDAINLLGNSISSFFLPLTKDQLSYIDDGLLELEVNVSEFNVYVYAVLGQLGIPAIGMRTFDWKVFFDSFVAWKCGLEDLCELMVDFGNAENIRRGQRILRNNWKGRDMKYITYLNRLFKVNL